MKALVVSFNQEKALVGAFSVIMNLQIIFVSSSILVPLLAAARAGVVAVVAAGVGRGCCGRAHQLVAVLQQQQQLHSSSFQFRFYNNYENVE